MIEIDHLVKRFGAVTAVDGLTFTVRPGHVTGFLGPNGAGKTTTMRVILGLDAPTSGRVTVNRQSYADLVRPLHQVGALLDAGALHPGRTAEAHLTSIARSNGIGRRRVAEMLRLTGLEPVAGRRLNGFSARHEAAARHRRRPARRPAGADVRRAGQRPGHRGHRLDPPLPAGAGRRRPHRPGLQSPDERDGADRRPADRHRPGPADRGHHHRRADPLQPAQRRPAPHPAYRRAGRAADGPRRDRAAGRTTVPWP